MNENDKILFEEIIKLRTNLRQHGCPPLKDITDEERYNLILLNNEYTKTTLKNNAIGKAAIKLEDLCSDIKTPVKL